MYQPTFKKFSEEQLVNVLLFGSESFTIDTNANILRRTTEFLKVTKYFNSLLFQEQTKKKKKFSYLKLVLCTEPFASVICLSQILSNFINAFLFFLMYSWYVFVRLAYIYIYIYIYIL